ncbi:MAG: radical SAM protein [Paludibacteraceae bacterium]|nr:radical SAM protein [Paludibacteraceae bacterium]
MIELLSIDISNYCSKQCSFCYNHSTKEGNVLWQPQEVIAFCTDCIENGIKAVSLGGGEPFEYDGIFDIIDALYSKCYLSVTTNGLPLMKDNVWKLLTLHSPDKIHITIHNPDNENEVERVLGQLELLKTTNIKPGVNLLVNADKIEAARAVYIKLLKSINSDQIIVVPQKFSNTPTPKQLASIANGKPFQSPSCLLGCKRPTNFVSVSWDKKVNSCSYAPNKEELISLDFKGLTVALQKINWKSCMHL